MLSGIVLHRVVDPTQVVRGARVHARGVDLRALVAPGDDARQKEGAVFSLTHERSAGVAVACVHAAFLEPGADHVLGDVRVVLLAATLFVRDDGNLRVLQELGLVTLARVNSPAGDGASVSRLRRVEAVLRQANEVDVARRL